MRSKNAMKAMEEMEADLQSETIEKEIDKIQNAIQNLNIKVLREAQELTRYKIRKNRRITKINTKIALKRSQISALAEQQLLSSEPISPFSTSALAASTTLTASEKDKAKAKAKHKEEEQEDANPSLVVAPNWDTRDPIKLVTWQLERHMNWAIPNPPWDSLASLHKILDLRTAAEVKSKKATRPRQQDA